MKYKTALAIPFITIALVGCEKLIEPKDKGMTEIKKIEQRWLDGTQLAGATARVALSSQVANLQSIKRDLDEVVVGKCLEEAKANLGESMEMTIKGFLEFMGDREYTAERTLEKGVEKFGKYKKARNKCSI
ncbi:hypothetical protein [Pseudidiomarina andamanensis]|uniref:Lipoprotein n=1 Tax=Pseudidiomarina andamanensis TaxID=1940690 RepID=A0AA92EU71_9GAMM|nr:hypothetical protein [Pseudidiomarina andamanensis]MDS0219623.1 hypothetical protein [Pseudidiomarina andamanensis]QGT95751.1 hypothetical protein D3795_06060 [Pseudidiomarina andamanensis]